MWGRQGGEFPGCQEDSIFWLSRGALLLMAAEIQSASRAASLIACNQENPSVPGTGAAGIPATCPSERKPLLPVCLPQLACWCLLTNLSLSPPGSRGQNQSTRRVAPLPRRPLPPSQERELPFLVKNGYPQKAAAGPGLEGRALLAAASPGCGWERKMLMAIGWKPWRGRACLRSMTISKNYNFWN